MAKQTQTLSYPALLRVSGRSKPLRDLMAEALAAGLKLELPHRTPSNGDAAGDEHLLPEIEDASAIDPSLTVEAGNVSPPQPGTGYAGLTPSQRHAFIAWSHRPHDPAPVAFQQLFLANLEARLFERDFRMEALSTLRELVETPAWRIPALHRAYLLGCWLLQDGERLAEWVATTNMPSDLLGIALGMQALIGVPLTARELGIAITTWQLGARLPEELLKMRLDSLTSILGQPPLDYAIAKMEGTLTTPRLWRMSHRGLRFMIPQPDVRSILEPSLHDLLAVADVDETSAKPISNLGTLDTKLAEANEEAEDQPSLEELGWRLILEFGSNRSEYFDYVLAQAQKLPGYSQLMDEDRRIVYRIIFRKSEMRRFWRIWDYVNGWTSTRVYLNGVELEKWKVWPYSQYLR
jgi:hypothetical protein